jgi:hypothetical protein
MELEPSFGGATLAVAAVAAGAPLFQDGYRAVRLRRAFSRMRERSLSDLPTGMVHVRGQVALESPLFSPLTGKPCAGFRLEVYSVSARVRGGVEQHRAFRIASNGVVARVWGHRGAWEIGVSDTRAWTPGDMLSANVEALLERVPEWEWLRRRGGPLVLTERALFAGAEIHVVAYGRQSRPLEFAEAEELAATGTDDEGGTSATPIVVSAPRRTRLDPPDLLLLPGESLDFLLVTDTAPANLLRRVPAWRSFNAFVGPLLAIGGLAYLAHAIDWLRARGGS